MRHIWSKDDLAISFDVNKFQIFPQIINVKDPNWWQAKHIGQNELTGLIPSQELEERRKAFVPPEADFVHTISICGTKVSVHLNFGLSGFKYLMLLSLFSA